MCPSAKLCFLSLLSSHINSLWLYFHNQQPHDMLVQNQLFTVDCLTFPALKPAEAQLRLSTEELRSQ